MRKDREHGAIVVEATISLTAFIFALYTILSIVNIYYIQAKMSVALNTAAKEISQYSYLYYKFGIDEAEAGLEDESTKDARETAKKTLDGTASFINAISDAKSSVSDGDIDNLINSINSGTDNVESLVKMYGDKLTNDPKGFALGIGKLVLSDLKDTGKVILGQIIAKSFMKKNLKAFKDDDPDKFLRRYNVVDGFDGLDFSYTVLMPPEKQNMVQLVMTYDIEVIKLLNIDFKFTIRQCSRTNTWGRGISKINPSQNVNQSSTIWDKRDTMERGQIIVLEEKKDYDYTASGQKFDAYDNKNGKNEFISIISVNTSDDSYQTAQGIKNRISQAYNYMYGKVESLDKKIYVQDKTGATVGVDSDPATRTYKVRIVVPENADDSLIEEAKEEFMSSHPGVEVEFKKGYGSPTPPQDQDSSSDDKK